jgi:hypothetical protein
MMDDARIQEITRMGDGCASTATCARCSEVGNCLKIGRQIADEAYRAGQEEMREEAAKYLEAQAEKLWSGTDGEQVIAFEDSAAAIRNLPIEAAHKGQEPTHG